MVWRYPKYDEYMHLRWGENQTYFSYPSVDSIIRLRKAILVALVRIEELDSVEDALPNSACGKKINILACSWRQADAA